MAIIVGIGIGLLAITALLIVITVRWLQAMIDGWRRITIHRCGGVLSILPDRDTQFSSPPPSNPAPDRVTNSKPHP